MGGKTILSIVQMLGNSNTTTMNTGMTGKVGKSSDMNQEAPLN